MRVKSLIRRPQGHVAVLGGLVEYAFRPPLWECEVTEPSHLARFAAIPEGYRLVAAAEPLADAGKVPEGPSQTPPPLELLTLPGTDYAEKDTAPRRSRRRGVARPESGES